MEISTQEQAINANLTDKQFYELSEHITKLYGIKLPLEKKVMLQSRLRKRLAALKYNCFKDYLDYLFENEEENEFLIIEVSTNKTDMFRERSHFDFLENTYLPEYLKSKSKNDELKIWSSACSTGEEAYTTAIVLEEFIANNEAFNYSIHATDISTKTLQIAHTGIYKEERIKDLPIDLKKKYYLKSKDKVSKQVRVKPNIRSKVKFDVLNLMDRVYNTPDEYDIIFCRNVLIYFNKDIQAQVISRLVDRLKKGGILFIGHSESLMGMNLPLELVKPTIFRKLQ